MNVFLEIVVFIGLGISIAYFVLVILLFYGWKNIREYKICNTFCKLKISVVVAARNEEKNIVNLLQTLILQDYDSDSFEIIIVDDWSEDNTLAIATEFAVKHSQFNIRVYSLSVGNFCIQGKKQALQAGYYFAKGEIIVTTDADCEVPVKWLSAINNYFENYDVEMLLMPVKYNDGKGFLHQWQQIELCSLMGVAAGSVYWGKPLLCNGANLAFRKTMLEKLGNNFMKNEFASGDDIFMLLAAQRWYKGKIAFLKSLDVVVKTNATTSLKQFVNQRLRWVSKNRVYNDRNIIISGMIVLLMQFVVLFFLIAGFYDVLFLIIGFSMFIIKIIIDYYFIKSIINFFKINFFKKNWIVYQILYLIYVVGISLLSIFLRFSWKGRRYKY